MNDSLSVYHYTKMLETVTTEVSDTESDYVDIVEHHDCEVTENYELLCRLINQFEIKYCDSNEDSHKILQELQQRVWRLSQVAPHADYPGTPSNGYRSLLRCFTHTLEVAVKFPEHKKKLIYSFLTVIQEICHILHHCLPESSLQDPARSSSFRADHHEYQGHHHDHNANGLTTTSLKTNNDDDDVSAAARRRMQHIMTNGKSITEFFLSSKFCGINFDRRLRRLLRIHVMMSSLFLSDSFSRTVKNSLRIRKAHKNYVNQLASNPPHVVAQYVRKLNWFPVTMTTKVLNSLSSFPKTTSCRTVKVLAPSPFVFQVSPEGVTLNKRSGESVTTPVKMRVMRSGRSNSETADKVLMFLHGGGFMGPSAEAVEDIFIKNWATRIPGLTILNVDFSLAPENPFPRALQEVLDLYLWLVSGCPTVKETLSFNPCEVIVSGDSSGGNIAAALILALNDLRHDVSMMESLSSKNKDGKKKKKKFQMPKSLVLFFAKLSIDLELYPSSLLSILDPLVNPFFMLRAAQAYIPFFQRQEDGSKKMITRDNNSLVPQDWIHDDRYHPVRSYYLSPLHYTSFHGLTDVSLHVMAYNFDPFLDESILFAKKWKGTVHLQVLDGLCHAGFYFKLLNSRASQASKAAVDMIRRSL